MNILGLQPRDKAAMLVVKTKEFFLLNLHQNRVHFPAERNAFVLDHQHGRRDVTCKPAICIYNIVNIETSNSTNSLQNQPRKHQGSNEYNIRTRLVVFVLNS